jgi:ATP-dependent Lon protease
VESHASCENLISDLWSLISERQDIVSEEHENQVNKNQEQPVPEPGDKIPTPSPSVPEESGSEATPAQPVAQETSGKEQLPSQPVPATLPILPLRGTVVFPQIVVPLAAGQARSLRLIDDVVNGDRLVGLIMQKDSDQPGDAVKPGDTLEIGAMGIIHQMMRVPDGTVRLVLQGVERIKIGEFVQEQPYLRANVEFAPERVEDTLEIQGQMRATIDLFGRLVAIAPNLADDLLTVAINLEDPRHLAYFIASNLRLDAAEKQKLLELDEVKAKFEELNGHMSRELEVLEIGKKIQSEVQEEVSKTQREYYLREQLKAIQKELGETN